MTNSEILYQGNKSIRNLPINFNENDINLFEHELERAIPATALRHLEDITASPDGTLFWGSKILPESFPYPHFMNTWIGYKARLKFFARHFFFGRPKKTVHDAYWITDIWSLKYFHWMTDALPRLYTIRNKTKNATLLLPGAYEKTSYVEPSLQPFCIQDIAFIHGPVHCKNLNMPTHTAPTGNYNEHIIRDLRDLFTDFYQNAQPLPTGDKIYISRAGAEKRKIANEEECVSVLAEYGFKTVYFEEHAFEQQIRIASDARYLVSNHGAGLTNMLFMKTGSHVFELRKKDDAHNNCYFALASALNLNYFYQLCSPENPGQDANTANIVVDCQLLRKNIEQMLTWQPHQR